MGTAANKKRQVHFEVHRGEGTNPTFPAHTKNPAEAGFSFDHSNVLSAAVLAMVDLP